MAKNWNINEETGLMTRLYTDDVEELTVDLTLLFPDNGDGILVEDVQRACVINGMKQKLDDSIARSKDMKLTEAEKRVVQAELWNRISVEREWNMPKATGARGPAVSYKVIIPALEESGLDAEAIALTLNTTLERVIPFMKPSEEEVTE